MSQALFMWSFNKNDNPNEIFLIYIMKNGYIEEQFKSE